METRKLGWTDLEFTTVGLGCWAMGGDAWGPQEDENSVRAVHAALESGVNWIDTAPVYGTGHSEKLVGRALREAASKPLVATKCGLPFDEDGNVTNCLKAASIRNECEASLRRLGVDVIDLYQIHWPNPEAQIEEGWEEMARLREEGKVRHVGVSNFSAEQLERASRIEMPASLQPPYSMLKREIEEDVLPWCEQHDVGVVPYSPMQRGLLTGKFTHERVEQLPEGDHRRNHPMFQRPQLSRILETVEKLRPIAERNEMTLAQLAVVWTLRKPVVTAAIVGARTSEQARANAEASGKKIRPDDLEEIEGILKEYEA